uniref:Uncharacterized protein n=1 Tax=Lactuca sativa TaxID=4236 RepID=A0A9R1X8S6_LACSA|nr:hypothetical protein LSAT_V11C500255500 [Lactuca sativa]
MENLIGSDDDNVEYEGDGESEEGNQEYEEDDESQESDPNFEEYDESENSDPVTPRIPRIHRGPEKLYSLSFMRIHGSFDQGL